LREERSRTSRLERQDEMRVHEQDARRFIIDLSKAIFLHPLFIFKISEICLKFESKISYMWKELK
jgi:hypothetical protein